MNSFYVAIKFYGIFFICFSFCEIIQKKSINDDSILSIDDNTIVQYDVYAINIFFLNQFYL